VRDTVEVVFFTCQLGCRMDGLRATDRFLACMASCAHVSNDDCAYHAYSMLTTALVGPTTVPLCPEIAMICRRRC
jgi:hypothetical protein